jgi:ATP-dependent Clp protease ATP-binding subunit ClpC
LYVLDHALAGIAATAPTDIFVHLRPSGADRSKGAESEPFAALLADMYVAWAGRCGMQAERVAAPAGEHVLAISGLGCGEILAAESGLHVLEHVDEDRDGTRIADRDQVLVLVLPRHARPESGADALAREVREALAAAEPSMVVVRRYRPGRAQLVRDSIRHYRTGRLDRVLAGDFDLY